MLLVGLAVIRVGAWVLAGAGHVSEVAAGVLADALMNVVVFVAWTVAALAALGLLAALAHGVVELHDRRSRKQWAARRVRPVAVPLRPAPEEAAPATPPMPAASDPVAVPVVEQPVLGRLAYPPAVGDRLDDRDPGGSDRDDEPLIETALPTLPYDDPVFGGSDRDDEPLIETALPALLYDDPVFGGTGEGPRCSVPEVWSAMPPNPVSEDAPIIDGNHVPPALPASQNPTPPLAPTSIPQAPPVTALLVLACRGVQIGDDNEQFNTYTYTLQDPTVDFAKVLRRPTVRDALNRLIMDPKNDELRTKAAEALCAGKWTLREKELLDLGPLGRRSPHSDVTRDLKAMQGFITVRNCQGVQTGKSCYQQNDFIYACRRATVSASSLLKSHPEVTSSLIDAVVMPSQKEWKEPGEKLNAAVRAALNSPESLDAIPDRSIKVSPRSAGVLRDRDGVSIGYGCHAADFKAVMVELRDPRNLPKCVVKESGRLMDHMAAQLRRQASARREPPSPPRRSVTSAPDLDGLLPPPSSGSPNRGMKPPSDPESPSSGRGIGF
ncbi:RIP homotypic interaction motif-containing protein [Streptomyces sp. SID12488]|uniref:RIP homotypic interaction motif-containing protein n=1 Tax=Streptomyces sp. SID12488 TaxID=2706040 RepID=UPI0013DD72B2|nr:RIP homotypic interaction motif-containing protein [Streptomyces sp. SID12488]NEA68651.1 hypothetical protein [Streptomyces sp. SID12488]